ncbi:hypothetical protein J5N97_025137 [Dioscorea zingiberensis]|uniref:PB1-like domain-containing protein n=1 Tax=Dioscorea zingiberensis TaxID=325984 RepID=A0A9D5H9L4_9LILI|nr:hypothetical protein J5N97_025137 [Dioscorea zingiberensis]
MVYEGGHVHTIKSVDPDYVCYFTLWEYFAEVGCSRGGRLWFKINGLPGNVGIEEITTDADTLNMLRYNRGYPSIEVFMIENDPPLAEAPPLPQDDNLQNVMQDQEGYSSIDSSDESYNLYSTDTESSNDSGIDRDHWRFDDTFSNVRSAHERNFETGHPAVPINRSDRRSFVSIDLEKPNISVDIRNFIGTDPETPSNRGDRRDFISFVSIDPEGPSNMIGRRNFDSIDLEEPSNRAGGSNFEPNAPEQPSNRAGGRNFEPNAPEQPNISVDGAPNVPEQPNYRRVDDGAPNFEPREFNEHDDMAEFNEPPVHEDDLLYGSDDDMRNANVDFDEDGDIKNPHLTVATGGYYINTFKATRAYYPTRNSHKKSTIQPGIPKRNLSLL